MEIFDCVSPPITTIILGLLSAGIIIMVVIKYPKGTRVLIFPYVMSLLTIAFVEILSIGQLSNKIEMVSIDKILELLIGVMLLIPGIFAFTQGLILSRREK